MIVRCDRNGWVLITQPAHAWMAGELAAAWGNERFASPLPREAVITATRLHDIGWLAWDAEPRLGEDGRPVNFLDTTLAETIPVWRRAVEQVSLLDPYAALLVSMHASTIYSRRLERGADPPERRAVLKSQQEEHAAIQESFRLRLSDHADYGPAVEINYLNAAYRWLRACDLLSLVLCVDQMPAVGTINAFLGAQPMEPIQINYSRPRPFEIMLDPTPFAAPLELEVQTRRLTEITFPSQATYLAALEDASWETQTVTVSGP